MGYISRYSSIPAMPTIKNLQKKLASLAKYTEEQRSQGYATRDVTPEEFSLLYIKQRRENEIRAEAENKPYLLKENVVRQVARSLRIYTPKTVEAAAASVGMTVEEFKEEYKNKTTKEIWHDVGGDNLNDDSSSEEWADARARYNQLVTEG